jgi:hypothetical protein
VTTQSADNDALVGFELDLQGHVASSRCSRPIVVDEG